MVTLRDILKKIEKGYIGKTEVGQMTNDPMIKMSVVLENGKVLSSSRMPSRYEISDNKYLLELHICALLYDIPDIDAESRKFREQLSKALETTVEIEEFGSQFRLRPYINIQITKKLPKGISAIQIEFKSSLFQSQQFRETFF